MRSDNQEPKESVFYYLVYWIVRLRAGLVALILVLATIFIYQYWLDLTQNPLSLIAKVQTDISTLAIYMPEKFTYAKSGIIADVKIVPEPIGKEIVDSDTITISFTGDNLNFEPPQIIMSKSDLTTGNTYNIKVSSESDLGSDDINLGVSIANVDKAEVSIVKTLSVGNKLKNPIVLISGLLSFVTAILSFIVQMRNLFSKR